MKPISRSFKMEIKKAVHNLQSFLGMPDDAWVRRLLDTAHGVALLSVVKLAFVGGLQGGGGLVLARDLNSGAWSAPCAVGIAGLSVGAAVGGELNTVLLILNTKEALDVFANSTQVTLGGNLGIALGPIGRNIEAPAPSASARAARPSRRATPTRSRAGCSATPSTAPSSSRATA